MSISSRPNGSEIFANAVFSVVFSSSVNFLLFSPINSHNFSNEIFVGRIDRKNSVCSFCDRTSKKSVLHIARKISVEVPSFACRNSSAAFAVEFLPFTFTCVAADSLQILWILLWSSNTIVAESLSLCSRISSFLTSPVNAKLNAFKTDVLPAPQGPVKNEILSKEISISGIPLKFLIFIVLIFMFFPPIINVFSLSIEWLFFL